jgi:hypothetical protein
VNPRRQLGIVSLWSYVSVWDVFTVPLTVAVGYTVWTADTTVPLWQRYGDVMPIEWWATALWIASAALIAGFAFAHVWTIRIAYVLLFGFWAFTSFAIWRETPSLFFLVLCLSIANGCILRQAALAYQTQERAP